MPVVTPEQLASLQRRAECVRNICILAHVDHGKTSLTDVLLVTNGIVSPRLAGKTRYLDSRPDEQLRGITMKSSAISLYFPILRRPSPTAEPVKSEYLINLIDSPGHIDFSSEVSTASRLCDGAIVLVDAVEGVCSQTVTVLRQTWEEKLKPLLVINKMDRLRTELRLDAMEAYEHLNKILGQVNAVLGSFFQGERMEEDLNWRETLEKRAAANALKEGDTANGNPVVQFEERDDEDIYFAPEKNNVIFGSAIDGWAFTLRQFAIIYEKKLGVKREILEKGLWGDFYLDPKTMTVIDIKRQKGSKRKPMFVQLILEQVWKVYEAIAEQGNGDSEPLEKVTKALNINIPPQVKRSKEPRLMLTTVFDSWLPLSTAVLVSVVELLPSPPTAQAKRLPELLDDSPGADFISKEVRGAMIQFKQEATDPVVAYVSKMVSVPESRLPEKRPQRGAKMSAVEAKERARRMRRDLAVAQASDTANEVNDMAESLSNLMTEEIKADDGTPTDPEHLIGFARIYSGTISVGDKLYVIPPKWSPARPHSPEPQQITVAALYMFMGSNLEQLDSVPAGVVFGIGGLEGHILKSGTLCSLVEGAVNLAGVNMAGKPIVRVALEPVNPADLGKMIKGLQLLVQSDPCAEYEHLENGQHILLTAGELHLERCLLDLKERFARCEIEASKPIVPYRETTIRAEEMRPPANKALGRGVTVGVTSSEQISITLRVRPLPRNVTDFLLKEANAIKRIYSSLEAKQDQSLGDGSEDSIDADMDMATAKCLSMDDFRKQLQSELDSGADRETWKGVVDELVAFGPRRTGPNILIDATKDNFLPKVFTPERNHSSKPQNGDTLNAAHFSSSIIYAFQLATARGPLCNEPIQGIAVFVEDVSIKQTDDMAATQDKLNRLTGEVIKPVQSALHAAFLDWSPRLMLAMYNCEIEVSLQASNDVLGSVSLVVNRRHGRIVSESIREGTSVFTIQAKLPVADSFGFPDEMRKRTSGSAQPHLMFAGFEILDEDPFWVPFTEEDLEDLGKVADKENVAKRHMDEVRRRKGLFVEGKARDANKQSTMKR
jgi:ribosome assembly protein 1